MVRAAPGRISVQDSGHDTSLWKRVPSSDHFALLKQNVKYELCFRTKAQTTAQWVCCVPELCWQHDEEGRVFSLKLWDLLSQDAVSQDVVQVQSKICLVKSEDLHRTLSDSLECWLEGQGLGAFHSQLVELGASRVQDLCDLQPSDLDSLPLKPLQRRRIERGLREVLGDREKYRAEYGLDELTINLHLTEAVAPQHTGFVPDAMFANLQGIFNGTVCGPVHAVPLSITPSQLADFVRELASLDEHAIFDLYIKDR